MYLGSFPVLLGNSNNALIHTGDKSQIPVNKMIISLSVSPHSPFFKISLSVRVPEYLFRGLRKFHKVGNKSQNTTFTPEGGILSHKCEKHMET